MLWMSSLLLTLLALSASHGQAQDYGILSTTTSNVPSTETAEFSCLFENLWSGNSHPRLYPAAEAHWSPPVIAAHGTGYQMWAPGGMASSGVERVAEVGDGLVIGGVPVLDDDCPIFSVNQPYLHKLCVCFILASFVT
jgi:hypothetical protein